MPYREKTAWLSLIAIIVTFGPYFAVVGTGAYAGDPMPNLRQLGIYAAAALVRVTILGIGYLFVRAGSRQDRAMPLDERDRAIKARGATWAYYVLIVGMILVGGVMPFVAAGWAIVNAALFMLALSEAVNYGIVVVSYRRQS